MQLYLVLYQVGLKKAFKQVGIDTDLFKAYSTRSTSSSKASVGGAPLVEILKRGSWSHHSTWQRFYNKHIIQKGHVYQDMVYKESGKNNTLNRGLDNWASLS